MGRRSETVIEESGGKGKEGEKAFVYECSWSS